MGFHKHAFCVKGPVKESWTAIGTLAYPALGRRLVPRGQPIHPFKSWMERWFEEAGMTNERSLMEHFDHEVLWVARKK